MYKKHLLKSRKNTKIHSLNLQKNQKPVHIDDNVPVNADSVFRKGVRQEVGMLVFQPHMRHFKLSLLDKFSHEGVTDIYVLRGRVRHGVDRYLDRTLAVLNNLDARVPKIRYDTGAVVRMCVLPSLPSF